MSEKPQELPPIVGMNLVAEAGYPDVICPAVFLPGCNLRCPYCMNASIVEPEGRLPDPIPIQDVLEAILVRGDGRVLVSGGEPCIQPRLTDLVKIFIESDIGVRLSTNGTLPDPLTKLLRGGFLEFVAIDVKLDVFKGEASRMDGFFPAEVNKSVWEVHRAKQVGILDDYELRTTLYPPMVDAVAIESMARSIPPGAKWVLQQFRRTRRMLSPEASKVEPYGDDVLMEIVSAAKEIVPGAVVRYP